MRDLNAGPVVETVNTVGPDFVFENHGTLYLVRPQNEAARRHLQDNVQEDAQWWGDALVVEHRYALPLSEALADNGWDVA